MKLKKQRKIIFDAQGINRSQNSGLQSIPDKPEEESFVSDFSFNKNQRRNTTEIEMKEPDEFVSLSAQRARAEKEDYPEKRKSMVLNSAGLKKDKSMDITITRNSLNSAGLKKEKSSFEITEENSEKYGEEGEIENLKFETEQAEEEIPRNKKIPFTLKREMINKLRILVAKKKRSSIESSQNESSGSNSSNLTPLESVGSNKITVTLDKKMLSKFASHQHQHVRKFSYDTVNSFDMNLMLLNTPQMSSYLNSEVQSGVMDDIDEKKKIDEAEKLSEIEIAPNNFFENQEDEGKN